MTTTISDGTTTLTATVMDGYNATRESRTVVRRILGSNAPALSLREAGLRSGTHRLMFASQTVAEAAVAMLGAGVEITLADTDRANVGMTFVVSGNLSIELDDDTRDLWVVEFEYQETD